MRSKKGAVLVLSDGRSFVGKALGALGTARGEVVFTTGMAGYQETLTDPSFAGQIITFTYPHIGNYGVNEEDSESERIHAVGCVVRAPAQAPSNHRATDSLAGFLRARRVVGISDIDTRALTRHIRSEGARPGLIASPFDPADRRAEAELNQLRAEAAGLPGMAGRDLAHKVGCSRAHAFEAVGPNATGCAGGDRPPHVVVYDFGMKRQIARSLARRGARVTVVPPRTSAGHTLSLEPDGVLLSNGPGDPDAVAGAPEAIAGLLGRVPIFGICLGHQILALALGARTYKMKFGHRGVNQPVKEIGGHRVYITSQNHGFAVDATSLPPEAEVTFVCPNDGALEGFVLPGKRAMAVQFHPEACPGPHDTAFLFDRFLEMCRSWRPDATAGSGSGISLPARPPAS